MSEGNEVQGRRRMLVVAVKDELLRDALVAALEGNGLAVEGMTQQRALDNLLVASDIDLLMIDPDPAGSTDWTMVRRIRSASEVRILALATSGEPRERLEALRSGADAVLGSPFSLAELIANVGAILRRGGQAMSTRYAIGDLILDDDEHTVTRAGKALSLTALEFNLLQAFCRNHRRVLSKTQLLSIVWGFDEFDPNVVEVHVSAIRRKMEAHGSRMLHTVRGVGYVLRAERHPNPTGAAIAS